MRRAHLVGWNKGGHDGAYPQALSGGAGSGWEARLRALIAEANAAGFQIVCHTCFFSAYMIADDFDEEYLLKERMARCSRVIRPGVADRLSESVRSAPMSVTPARTCR